MKTLSDTICAVSTAPGVGGIAVIRVSGVEAITLCDAIFDKSVRDQAHMSMSYGSIVDGEHLVDEVVLSKFVGPRSYTGEDVIEISCHGSLYIQQDILRLLQSKGCRLAEPGEFSKRAFLNGKMDLSQTEAVADLIASESAAAHQLALLQMRGGYSDAMNELREKLTEFAALIELELDFSEEDVEFADREQFKQLITLILSRITELEDSFRLGNVIKNGVPVTIIGAPNAGKSTLLNALLNEDRAIVSDIAGTTRDTIEDTVNIAGISFRFIDTAGLRSTTDSIESQGIAKAMSKAQEASIVIRLMDASQEKLHPEERLYADYFAHIGWEDDERTMGVLNKVDLIDNPEEVAPDALHISAKAGLGIDKLKDALLDRVALERNSASSVIVSNARHMQALNQTKAALEEVQDAMAAGLSSDLLTVDIRKALHYLGEVTGEVTTEDLLGTIFSRFCIGK